MRICKAGANYYAIFTAHSKLISFYGAPASTFAGRASE